MTNTIINAKGITLVMLPKSIKGRYELLGVASNFLQKGSITLNILLEIVRNGWNRNYKTLFREKQILNDRMKSKIFEPSTHV